jgi:hypothetical protein
VSSENGKATEVELRIDQAATGHNYMKSSYTVPAEKLDKVISSLAAAVEAQATQDQRIYRISLVGPAGNELYGETVLMDLNDPADVARSLNDTVETVNRNT